MANRWEGLWEWNGKEYTNDVSGITAAVMGDLEFGKVSADNAEKKLKHLDSKRRQTARIKNIRQEQVKKSVLRHAPFSVNGVNYGNVDMSGPEGIFASAVNADDALKNERKKGSFSARDFYKKRSDINKANSLIEGLEKTANAKASPFVSDVPKAEADAALERLQNAIADLSQPSLPLNQITPPTTGSVNIDNEAKKTQEFLRKERMKRDAKQQRERMNRERPPMSMGEMEKTMTSGGFETLLSKEELEKRKNVADVKESLRKTLEDSQNRLNDKSKNILTESSLTKPISSAESTMPKWKAAAHSLVSPKAIGGGAAGLALGTALGVGFGVIEAMNPDAESKGMVSNIVRGGIAGVGLGAALDLTSSTGYAARVGAEGVKKTVQTEQALNAAESLVKANTSAIEGAKNATKTIMNSRLTRYGLVGAAAVGGMALMSGGMQSFGLTKRVN